MKLVTVFTSFNPVEAQLIRSLLESADLLATVTHETAALTTDGYAMSVGGIEVQVPEDQVEDARALINTPVPDPPSAQ
jgi:hypothetical protein